MRRWWRSDSRRRLTLTKCKTGAWLGTCDDEDRAAFTDYLARGGSAAQLHKLCVAAGFDGGLTAVKDHARGRCCCE